MTTGLYDQETLTPIKKPCCCTRYVILGCALFFFFFAMFICGCVFLPIYRGDEFIVRMKCSFPSVESACCNILENVCFPMPSVGPCNVTNTIALCRLPTGKSVEPMLYYTDQANAVFTASGVMLGFGLLGTLVVLFSACTFSIKKN